MSKNINSTPQEEPAPTPLISSEQLSLSDFPLVNIPEGRFYALKEHASRIANSTRGECNNHLTGLLGEDTVAHYFGIEDRLETEVYADGGDGGFDLQFQGATIDVKTVGRCRQSPALTVDAHKPLRADYYVLASRVGRMTCRLIGYAPREFVADALQYNHRGKPYHIVEQEYLFPFTHGVDL